MSKFLKFSFVVLICLFSIYMIFAAETGEIKGKVVDEQGIGLPGVTIRAKSPNLLGIRTAISRSDGSFRFSLLPIGTYILTYELEGFITVIQKDVIVRLGMVTSLSTTMKIAKLREEITVTAEPPLVDKTSVDTSYRISSRDLETVPTQARTVEDIVKFTPGVTGVRSNTRRGTTEDGFPSFRGEGEEGNNWLVDGLSMRGVRLNKPRVRINYDAIDEIQIISDPFSPDLASTFGGIINVVTKTGGNDFHGELGVLFGDERLQASRKEQLSIASEPESFSRYNWYFNLGGPIIKNKLWFFFSDNFFSDNDVTEDGYIDYLFIPRGERTLRANNFFGKLTYSLSNNHTLSFSGAYDKFLNQTSDIGRSELYEEKPFTNYLYRLNYKGILSSNTLVEAAIGQTKRDSLIKPQDDDLGPALYFIEDVAQNIHNSLGRVTDDEKRTDFTFRMTQHFDTKKIGHHELSFGFQYYKTSSEFITDFSGKDEDPFPDNGFDNGTKYFFDTWQEGQGTPTLLWEYGAFNFTNSTQGIGLYLKDKITWGIFTLMLGFRSETQINYDDQGEKVWSWSLGDFLSPRASLTIDLTNDGKNVLKLGWGKFADTTTTMHLGFFNPQAPLQFRRYSWIGPSNPDENQLHNPANWKFIHEERQGPYEIYPLIKPNFTTKYLIEFDRRLGSNWAAKVRLVNSWSRDLLELLGIFDPSPPYYKFIFDNFEHKKRDYIGFEIEVNGKIRDIFFLNASYSHASAKGTNPGQVETGSWSQEEGSTYYVGLFGNHVYVPDIPGLEELKEFFDWGFGGLGGRGIGDEGWYGKLPYSIDHNAKMNITYLAPYGIAFSTAWEWISGYHWEKLGLVPFFGYYAFPEGRGSRETPSHLYMDFGVEKNFALSGFITGLPEGVILDIRLDVFNLFNSQKPISFVKEDIPIFGQVWARQEPRQVRLMLKLKW
ncbi:MAG: carboxypeptidase regulatory-like domain-containing protein [Candidatus Aminicenantia bacterium]